MISDESAFLIKVHGIFCDTALIFSEKNIYVIHNQIFSKELHYIFNEMNSLFHLVLGSVNIAVWVFFRERYLDFSFASLFKTNKKDQSSI